MTQSIKRTIRCALKCFTPLFVLLPLAGFAATINVPSTATPTIQSGIDAAASGDTVLVAPGTYKENIDFKGKEITVTSSGGAASTIIDGGRTATTVVMSQGETRNSILSNFTITDGAGFGGISAAFSSPTIVSNIITLNHCYGIVSNYASPLIESNEISYTLAVPYECTFASGTGIWIFGNQEAPSTLNPEIIGNTIEQNTQSGLEDAGGNGGGGIAVWAGTPVIANNIIRNNATGRYFSPAGGGEGGGIYFAVDGGLVVNNLIYGNTSNLGGGGIFLATENGGTTSTLAIINNTIVDNAVVPVTTYSQALIGGEQIYFAGGSNSAYTVNLSLENNIIGGSTANPSVVCYDGTIDPVSYSHNNFYNNTGSVTGTFGGTCTYPSGTGGNISASPSFLSQPSQDYHLLISSPGVDRGNNEVVTAAAALGYADLTDLDKTPRLQDATGQGCTIDMGAYEFPGITSDCSSTTETLQSSLNPSVIGQNVTFATQLTSTAGTPTGDVQFSDGTTVLNTQTVSGTGSAAFSTSALSIGSHTITAKYQPGGTFDAASATLTQVVKGASTETGLTSSLNPANAGQSITFTATVTTANGTPTGLITLVDGATTLGVQTLVNGVATFTTSTLAIGTHSILAAYNPTGGVFEGSNTTLSQVVNGIPTTTSLVVTPTRAAFGTAIQMTSDVMRSGARVVGGSITFMDGSAVLGSVVTTIAAPIAIFSTSALAVGTHTITAVYSGDLLSGVSTSPAVTVTITAASSTLGLSAAPNPGFALHPVTLIASLVGGATGSAAATPITFLANGSVVGSGTTDAQGTATLTTTFSTGTYTLVATFAGNASLVASTSAPVMEIINPNPTSTAVFAQPNPGSQGGNETVTATVNTLFSSSATPPVPVGSVAFFDAGVLFATANLDARGQANFSTATLTVGSHSIIATYLGTPNFLSSNSSPYILNILPRDFTLTTEPTITIQTEHHKDLSLTLTSIGDFTDTVVLSCASLPSYATCTFPTNGPVLAAGATQTSSVHIDTDALLNYISSNDPERRPQSRPRRAVAYGLLLPVILIAMMRRRRKLPRILGLCIVLSTGLMALTFSGCSARYPGHTPPGTYTFTVTGAGVSTHISHSATVTLIVSQ